jgi:hypothetical protein
MKRILLAGATAAAITFSGQALAQRATVEIAPEQRTKIKDYVVKEKVRPVTVKERVRIGARLPADVELRDVPSDWGPSVSRYKYIYSDNRVHFVDPASREVVYDID